MFWEKFLKFANYSDLILSKFGQPNNLAFGLASQKNELFEYNSGVIHESCDHACIYQILCIACRYKRIQIIHFESVVNSIIIQFWIKQITCRGVNIFNSYYPFQICYEFDYYLIPD